MSKSLESKNSTNNITNNINKSSPVSRFTIHGKPNRPRIVISNNKTVVHRHKKNRRKHKTDFIGNADNVKRRKLNMVKCGKNTHFLYPNLSAAYI